MCLGKSTPKCHVQQYHLKCTYFTHSQFWSRNIKVCANTMCVGTCVCACMYQQHVRMCSVSVHVENDAHTLHVLVFVHVGHMLFCQLNWAASQALCIHYCTSIEQQIVCVFLH